MIFLAELAFKSDRLLGLIRLIRHVGKFNTGKVILFFLLIGIITAILFAGIAAAIL